MLSTGVTGVERRKFAVFFKIMVYTAVFALNLNAAKVSQ